MSSPRVAFRFPAAVPEVPVALVEAAAAYYVERLGFTLDWGDEAGGIAGVSRGEARLFLTNGAFREGAGNGAPVVIWLNVSSRAEVDELFAEWRAAGGRMLKEPADMPWKLREFTAEDPDGNRIRVFYDFSREG